MQRLGLVSVLVLAGLGPAAAPAKPANFLDKSLDDWVAELDHKDARVRRSAAFALGKMRVQAEAAVTELVAGLNRDADPAVRKAAGLVWEKIKGQDAAAVRAALREFKAGKDAAAGKVAARALVQAAAVDRTATEIATAAVPKLARLLRQDDQATVREAAAFALGEIGPAAVKALPALPGLLGEALTGDASPLVRRSAAFALGSLGLAGKDAAAAVKGLEKAVPSPKQGGDASPAVRQNAAWALGRLRAGSAVVLAGALEDDDALVRRDAAAALDQVAVPDADRPAVKKKLFHCFREDANLIVRQAALLSLVRLVDREDAQEADALKKSLKDPDPEVRRNAALALGNMGDAEVLPLLRKALAEEGLIDRQKAALTLKNLGPKAEPAIPDLIQALQDPDPTLNVNAALALGSIGAAARTAVDALVQVADDPARSNEARSYSVEAIKQIAAPILKKSRRCPESEKAIPILLKILDESDNPVRLRQAVIWAVELHDLRAVGALPTFDRVLREKAAATKLVRYNAATSLAWRLGQKIPGRTLDRTLDVLMEYLNDPTVSIYHGTGGKATGQGEGGKGGSKVARDVRGDGRKLAADALANLGPAVRRRRRNDIISKLQELSRDARDKQLRKSAAAALDYIKR
jgi:HEAT repeat protein